MNGVTASAPLGAMYVRALYDYEADDRTSLSFHEGDVIQVITQLESGWWDGVINGVRGWFPSNYCQMITSLDEFPELEEQGELDRAEDDMDDGDIYEEELDEDLTPDQEELPLLPLEGTDGDRSRADFWIPQATPDGRLFYYNTMTGESSMELPLESPSSVNETGPRDRMNVNMPDRTRPPPELMASGLMQDEDEASEAEGEAVRGLLVRNLVSPGASGQVTHAEAVASASTRPGDLPCRVHGLDEWDIPSEAQRHVWSQPYANTHLGIYNLLHRRRLQSPDCRDHTPLVLRRRISGTAHVEPTGF